jgi:hypothetical protein
VSFALAGATPIAQAAGPRAHASGAVVSASVDDAPVGQPLPAGFIGLSMEYRAVHAYTGRSPTTINPVFLTLLRALNPAASPVLRIGGDSTDSTWWPVKGMVQPGGINYQLTPSWMRTTRALARALAARMILGINLAAGSPALAAAEGRALLQGIGRSSIQAFEIGNEPDVYNMFPWYRGRKGRVFFARPRDYGFTAFESEFSHWRAALPSVPLAGPAIAELTWLNGLDQFLNAEPTLSTLTVHRYALRGCLTDTSSPFYPSAANLLADRSSAGLAQQVEPWAFVAHAHGIQLRVDELNSATLASCIGRHGVSETFASALWMLDTLFNLASVGVDGVNVHTLPKAGYEPFSFSHTHGSWSAVVHPAYYAMLMFTRAFPAGARLLPVIGPSGSLKLWATRGRDGRIRVVLINKDPTSADSVDVQVPDAAQAAVQYLSAPSLNSTTGVTLGGQTFGARTSTGVLPGSPQSNHLKAFLGKYSLVVPPASAVMLTQ